MRKARFQMAEIDYSQVSKTHEKDAGLFDFSVQIDSGESFGLIGPSGAGKSTAFSLLMGFIRPDEGEVSIRGLDCFSKRDQIMQWVGYLPRQAIPPRRMTGEAFIRLMAESRGGAGKSRMRELLERLDVNPLGDLALMPLQERRKVTLVSALIHGPEILVMEDPFDGLDPNARNAVTDLINGEREKGKTIVISSHAIEQAQRCCDRIGIIRKGRLVTIQSAQALEHTRQKVYHITFESIEHASAFAQEWDSGLELIRNRAIIAIPGSPQALISTLSKYSVIDLVGGREELEDSFLRSFGGDLI